MSFPRRIVEDYDVDRLEVEVRQRMQLTSTNHPYGLIPVLEFAKIAKTVNGLGTRLLRKVGKDEVLRVDVRERAAGASPLLKG